jgi:hypothetical protein
MASSVVRDSTKLPPIEEAFTLHDYASLTFIDANASERFICIVCADVAFAPPSVDCNHVHCRRCLEKTVRRECPQCRIPVSDAQLTQINGYVQHEIQQLHVRCPRAEYGCEWTGALGSQHHHLRDHHLHCEYHQVICKDCDLPVLRKNAYSHSQECVLLPVACQDCQLKTGLLPISTDDRLDEKQQIVSSDADSDSLRMISSSWLKTLRTFHVSADAPRPGPICNHVLFAADGKTLLPQLKRGIHYRALCMNTWLVLHSIYGGGPMLERSSTDIYSAPSSPT